MSLRVSTINDSINQSINRGSPRLRLQQLSPQQLDIRLENESRVGTPIRRNLIGLAR